jgi:hypothetical protein
LERRRRRGWGWCAATISPPRATTQQEATITVPARRGAITDRRGTELAVSEPAFSVAANPYLISDPQATAARISHLLGVTEDVLLKKLTLRRTGFVYLARKVPAERARKAQDLRIEGLEFIPDARRIYPRDWLASSSWAWSARTTRAWPASSAPRTRSSAASPGAAGWSRTRSATRSRCRRSSRHGRAPTSG